MHISHFDNSRYLAALFALFLMAAGLYFVTNSTTAWALPDPRSLYGKTIVFDVHRNGEKVGHHHVVFENSEDSLKVNSTFQLEIKLLFIVAYRFTYISDEVWQNGQLIELKSDVNDDGDKALIELSRDTSGLKISGPEGTEMTSGPLYVTTHWNSAVINENRVLNTLTGRINRVDIKRLKTEIIDTENGPVSATRFAYTGDLDTEVWYDDTGRWVKMKFKGRDGSDIEYKCIKCQGGVEQNEPSTR